ncbi:MAG: CBS domain-containing protein [Myxococcales bacterium]|nr:CBS domain-containing protein [Myxococcales bacterium]
METLSNSIQAAMRTSSIPPAIKMPKARDIMVTAGLITFRPKQRLAAVIRSMLRHQISGAPVVDGEMRLVGMISEYDCMRVIAAGAYEGDPVDGERTVAELMSTDVTTIDPDLNLYGIAHVFMTRGRRRLPVVADGNVVGQLSRRDVLRAIDKLLS